MRFRVLSHAGLEVVHESQSLVCDPWLVGSSYWRSWWNYPPVSEALIQQVVPDVIYLTHIHWDHFHGVSLKKFPRSTRIVVPKGNYSRMAQDLRFLGFTNIEEVRHGQTLRLGEGLRLTSYQFSPFLDSAVVIEAGDTVLLNANDAKLMGGPLKQVIRRHPKIDFVLRSHSSANSRLCFEIMDRPERVVDDLTTYIREFAEFALASGARYAIPFASNSCYLHPETFRFNETGQTPQMVSDYFAAQGITSPEVVILLSGDGWSEDSGFEVHDGTWFIERERHLLEYQQAIEPKLRVQAAKEAEAELTPADFDIFFGSFSKTIPLPLRRFLGRTVVLYVLKSGDSRQCFEVDIRHGKSKVISAFDDETHPIQIHTSAQLLRECMELGLFSHLAISKRVQYRVRAKQYRRLRLLNLALNCYEYDLFPLRRLFTVRSIENWVLRWRELLLYVRIALDLLRGGSIDPARLIGSAARSRMR